MSSINLLVRLARRLRADESGQTMIEYGGVALLISVAVIVLLSAIGLDIAEGFDYLENTLGLGATNDIDSAPGTDDTSAPAGVN
jgi:Flp pilus assembly pilin Flp